MDIDSKNIHLINDLKQKIDDFLPMNSKYQNEFDKRIRIEFNYNSNHIEGNTLTYGQTELLLFFGTSDGNTSFKDLQEMKAHNVAFDLIKEYSKDNQRHINEAIIRELNKIILVEPYFKEAQTVDGKPTRKKIIPGDYKETPNSVKLKSGEIHEYSSPENTRIEMPELVEWYIENEKVLHPVKLAAELHYRFISIHPFDDGNGRVARLLTNYSLIRQNYPPVIIKTSDKANYLNALRKADLGDRNAFIEYIEKELIWSLELKLKAARGESLIGNDELLKEVEILKRNKLNTETYHKTPKVCFEILTDLESRLWNNLQSSLIVFDDFFTEMADDIYIGENRVPIIDRIEKEKSAFIDQFEISSNYITEYSFHNHNLIEKPIESVSFKQFFLGIKTSGKRIDIVINLSIDLRANEYHLELTGEHNNAKESRGNIELIFEKEYPYNRYLLSNEIESISNQTIKYLMEFVKEIE